MNLTPWTRRLAIACLTGFGIVALAKGYPSVSGMALGGILAIINPEKKDG